MDLLCSFISYLDLPVGVDVHPIFHVSRLKELIGSNNNVAIKDFVIFVLIIISRPTIVTLSTHK